MTVEALFARYVECDVVDGRKPDPEELCDDPVLLAELRAHIRRYEELQKTLSTPPAASGEPPPADRALPQFDGFRTIERIGGGGGGEVYKLEDLELGRIVAAKVIRRGNPLQAGLEDFLREARAMALFDDPRIARIFEFRRRSDPPVLLMEYVDGFELDRIGPSLEYPQRARAMAEIAEAMHRAHTLGIQHRDLKPANVMLDANLAPRILDFGLSQGDPARGHLRGTPAYMAPEQRDRDRPIDARTDVYALGVMLYQLLCGALPDQRLPVEIEPTVPEPLQAIALKAMEADPQQRYATALEMAQELRRFLAGRPVLARPTLYQSALERRVRPHLEQIREWRRIKLIYPHEAERLAESYRDLEAREDDWIAESRVLSQSQISLYLGAFLVFCGGALFFTAYLAEAFSGLGRVSLALGLPFLALGVAGYTLYRRERRAVAVAYYLAAVVLLPLLCLILFREAGWWPATGAPREFFAEVEISNRQLQLAALAGCAWSGLLAWRTRTIGLGSGFTAMVLVAGLALLTDLDLAGWIEDGRWDRLSLHLTPLLVACFAAARLLESRGASWFARPLYYAAIGLFVLVLELLALDGRAFGYLGLTLADLQAGGVSNPTLLDTVGAMIVNGVAVFAAATALDRFGSELMRRASRLLFVIAPFLLLEPVAYLDATAEYSRRFDWLYLFLALGIALASRYRQRKSFYYAGLLNTGVALWYITSHSEWFDHPWWSVWIILAALAFLAAGLGFDHVERVRRGGPSRVE